MSLDLQAYRQKNVLAAYVLLFVKWKAELNGFWIKLEVLLLSLDHFLFQSLPEVKFDNIILHQVQIHVSYHYVSTECTRLIELKAEDTCPKLQLEWNRHWRGDILDTVALILAIHGQHLAVGLVILKVLRQQLDLFA